MIVKLREVPLRIRQCEALLRRLAKDHLKYRLIYEEYCRRLAGYNAECKIDYFLNTPEMAPYKILHCLRLPDVMGQYFQIDTLIITPNCILIIEIKNLAGEIRFDQNHDQLTQIKNGEEFNYGNPITQAKNQKNKLAWLLKKHGFPNIRIEYLVAISNPHTKIVPLNQPEIVKKYVTHYESLIYRIEEITQIAPQSNINDQTENQLIEFFLAHHKDHLTNILDNFSISPDEIQIGVYCPKCDRLSVKLINLYWRCTICHNKCQAQAHQAVDDIFLLLGPTLTNTACQIFLQINSRNVAHRILKNYESAGRGKGMVYISPYENAKINS